MRLAALLLVAIAAGCSGSGSASAPDMDMSDLAINSNCGHPGDVGNSLGVGSFCVKISECFDNKRALLCAHIGDPLQYFCTFACHPDAGVSDAGLPECGENAECSCQGGLCGCTPTSCF